MSHKITGAGKYLPSSALYWFPQIRRAGLPVPTTRFVKVPRDYLAVIGGSEKLKPSTRKAWDRAREAVSNAAITVGGYPAFLRTDLASAKHEGPKAYRLGSGADVSRVMASTLEDNEMKWLSPAAFMIRRWLKLETAFLAFGGHPIAREWRFFASRDRVICRHFYWPEDSIEFFHGVIEPAGWQGILAKLAREPPPADLDQVAMRFAAVCRRAERWSVDFARDRAGKWWLIDAAVAEESAHPWDGCEIPNNEARSHGKLPATEPVEVVLAPLI